MGVDPRGLAGLAEEANALRQCVIELQKENKMFRTVIAILMGRGQATEAEIRQIEETLGKA